MLSIGLLSWCDTNQLGLASSCHAPILLGARAVSGTGCGCLLTPGNSNMSVVAAGLLQYGLPVHGSLLRPMATLQAVCSVMPLPSAGMQALHITIRLAAVQASHGATPSLSLSTRQT